jgi:hypothetical protein
MERWDLKIVDFEPGVMEKIKDFAKDNPQYAKQIDARINDLLNFPDLIWQSTAIKSKDIGHFFTRNQQIELGGKVYRKEGRVLVSHFSFHN